MEEYADELEWRKKWYEFIWVLDFEQAKTDLLYRKWLDTRSATVGEA